MKKPRIYITRKIPGETMTELSSNFDIRMWNHEETPVPREVLLEEAKNANGIVCMLTDNIDHKLLESAPNLQIIANMAVGYDNIDVEVAKEKGVIVTNTPNVLTETTADLTFALLMATARRIVEASNYIRDDNWKDWSPYLLAGSDIHGKTIGIVGMGRIGQAVAKRAKGFGMKILYHNRNRKPDAEKELQASYSNFENLISKSDYVVSVVPLTSETKYLFNQKVFEQMKASAIFINVSRGQVVDEEALYRALLSKQIKGAGLDVFENEPIRSNHPFLALSNVVCLPHIGSASLETRTEMIQLCMDNIEGFFRGTGAKTPVN
ncbi:2-hydroxyacid dehydrogenase [Ornithinibacillus salinisoli]|uniref:2-hydroxyacid dehydrogenase n=1 Tax=Ornithinibacillus salinisoli TaxID=1848459 RepID=A0ABW4W313_9BACI